MVEYNKRILITGANGFIGRELCAKLINKGWKVRGSIRSIKYKTLLPDSVEAVLSGSITSDTDWLSILEGVDVVVHLAARVHVMKERATAPLSEFRKVNVIGTEHLARASVRAGVRRFIYMSSIGVNGENTTEDSFTELSPPSPHNPYAVSKWEAEQALRKVSRDTGLEIVIMRPPLVYGPHAPGNFRRLLNLVRSKMPLPLLSIKNMRSFVYLENLVDAAARCIHHPAAKNQTFLISDNQDISTPELIRRLAAAMGKKTRLIPFPPPLLRLAGNMMGKAAEIERLTGSLVVDSTKIRKELEWEPPFTIDEGLRRTTEWFISNEKVF